jgi:ABC-type transport system substrate-binding protein
MRSVGIDVNVKKLDSNSYLNRYRNRDFEAIISGYHSEEKYLFYYFHSSQKNDP